MDVVGSQADFSKDAKFTEAVAEGHYGPVYFRRGRRPYMTLDRGPGRRVSVAEVNLKLIWDVVSQIRGQHARAGLRGRRQGV
jgi:hypothetical protein